MSDFRTHGYDIVLQYSATQVEEEFGPEINRFPNLRFEAEFPDFFEDLQVDIELSPNGARDIDFYTEIENGLRIVAYQTCQVTFPGGVLSVVASIVIRHPVSLVVPDANRYCMTVDFSGGISSENIEVRLEHFFWGRTGIPPLPTDPEWVTLFPTEDTWEAFQRRLAEEIASRIPGYLEDEVREIRASNCLCFNLAGEGPDPLVPIAIDFLVFPSSSDFSDGALIVLLTTRGGTPGDRNGFTAATIDYYPGADVLLLFGNDLVLRRIVCPALIQQWGFGEGTDVNVEDFFEFDGIGSASLVRNVSVSRWVRDPVEEAEFTSLNLEFVDDQIEANGWVRTSGTGWHCSCSFSGSVTGSVQGGVPRISAHIEPGYAELSYEPWFQILTSLGLFVLLPFLSVAITTPVREMFRETTEALVLSIFRCVFPAFSENLPFPFLCDADVDQVVLDDLAVFCRPVQAESAEESSRPDVWIEGVLDVSETGNAHTTTRRVGGVADVIKTTYEKAYSGAFRATTRHLTAPVSYRWSLGDQALEGSGSVTVDGSPVRYSVDWHHCEISTDLGVSLDTELRVVAEDGRGLVLEATLDLVADGQGNMMGVTGEEILMGPVVDLFEVFPPRKIDEILEVLAVPQWGERPDESAIDTTVHHNESISAFRTALCRGMGIEDESELPPQPR